MTVRLCVTAGLLLALGCEDPADDLPGRYVGTLDSNVSAARVANIRPDGAGDAVADITRYSSSSSSAGTEVVVTRHTAGSGARPVFVASLGEVCEVPFHHLEGGGLSENLLDARCSCLLDGEWVEGNASVTGSFHERDLVLDVSVSFMGSEEHTGGCTHRFESGASP